MQALNAVTFPLTGQQLIEASAGTGKTYTIANLYLRVLLAHQRDKLLPVDRILVVTFTRAATEELRGRIRQRIRETLESLLRLKQKQRQEDKTAALDYSQLDDEFLAQWLADSRLVKDKAKGVEDLEQWLQANLSQMDESSIFTIHGFCQRILQQFAFDSGALFSSEMILQTEEFLQQAAKDCWRSLVAGIDHSQADFIMDQFSGPEAIAQWVGRNMQQPEITFKPFLSNKTYDQLWQEWLMLQQKLSECWPQAKQQNLLQLIQDSDIDKRSYSKRNLPNWYQQLDDYLTIAGTQPSFADEVVFRFSQSVLTCKTKKGQAPEHKVFALIEQLESVQQALAVQFKQQVFLQCRELFYQALFKAGKISPNDLLRFLAEALSVADKDHSEQLQALKLADLIRQQYPVAMIDEFQDTDPLQYQIFSAIYSQDNSAESEQEETASEREQSTGLYMIGDPKQAIYGFRGADIFTYINAKRALSDQQKFTLDTNWRSHSQLVAATNDVWSQHESPFVYDQDISFQKVKAAGKVDDTQLVLSEEGQDDIQLQPLQMWLADEPLKTQEAKLHAADRCAMSVVNLLRQGSWKKTCQQGNAEKSAISSADIAILVRSHKQAELIKNALLKQGIVSVFLSRQSVYDSQEALDILSWLQAMHHPQQEAFLRNALACQTLALSAQHLHQCLSQEELWEKELYRLQNYRQLFLQRGPMAFLMAWLADTRLASGVGLSGQTDGERSECIAAHIRQQEDGERKLTNLLHIGEQLQQASQQLHHGGNSLGALLRWLSEKCLTEQAENQEQQLRLESDADLVNIVTIHKSKGLQYPIVFLPFLWDDTINLARGDCLYHEDQRVIHHLLPDDEAKKQQHKETLAENLRLLYVALTRAEFVNVIQIEHALSNKKSTLNNSALGYLLALDTDAAKTDSQVLLSQLLDKNVCHSDVSAYPQWSQQLSKDDQRQSETLDALKAKTFSGHWYDTWRVSSYSQLINDVQYQTVENDLLADTINSSLVDSVQPESLIEQPKDIYLLSDKNTELALEKFDQEAGRDEKDNSALNGEELSALTFPKGATPGSCLHAILENWDFVDPQVLNEQCAQQLEQYGIDEKWQAVLPAWLQQVCATKLVAPESQAQGFCLNQLKPENLLVEMEFYLPINTLYAGQLSKLLNQMREQQSLQLQYQDWVQSQFEFDSLKGQLKGFIDLIFCLPDEISGSGDRYFVADYKSNHLGDKLSSYLSENLSHEMQCHQYDLQYWIYSVALDQYLSKRLPDYDYERHFGGVYYLFLRGMSAPITTQQSTEQQDAENNQPSQASGVFYTRPSMSELNQWKKWLLAEGKNEQEEANEKPSETVYSSEPINLFDEEG